MTRSVLHDALGLVLAGTMLLGLAGCPSSGRQPAAEQRRPRRRSWPRPSRQPRRRSCRRPSSQQPLPLPPSEPLPKLAREPIDRPAETCPIRRQRRNRPARRRCGRTVGPPAGAEVQAAAGRPRTGKHSGVPFDPIKENGPIFDGWPKPKLAMVITGMEDGYIEPCGCAGLDRMKGGMGRRCTLLPSNFARTAGRWSGSTWAGWSRASAARRN